MTEKSVSHETVMQDYLLSNKFILPEYESQIDKVTAMGVEKGILLSI